MEFTELGLDAQLIQGLKEVGITSPTKIQVESLPAIIAGQDVIGMSKTGSGKTAAFGLPLLQRVTPGNGLQAVVLAPTRELAVQIATELNKWSRHRKVNIATIYGGVSFGPQLDAIEVADIVVGTPGRTLDHIGRGTLDLSKVHVFALDEADKMVDMGFIRDVSKILEATSEDRQILLFGATLSTEIKGLQRQFMKSPMTVKGEEHVAEDFLEQYFYNCGRNEKFSLLVHLLKQEESNKVIIFCSTRSNVELVTKNLRQHGIRAEMIHGKMTQNKRLQVVENIRKGKSNVLVGSAVAARGLDIQGVSHVYNYDLSNDPQEYVHRVGRTARAGQSGKAITLLGERDHDAFREILYRFRLNVTELPKGEFKRIPFDARRPPRRGGRNNDRRHNSGRNKYAKRV